MVKSPTITVTTTEAVPTAPSCPTWMVEAYKRAVERDMEFLKNSLETLAERRGCSLA